ncbi:MAG: hypothetical protein HY764_04095 [Candidatus Portnoybacteria bacterium]|nr:hypothetical protein [Candidatus Portnoybacteria bacterium]
MAKIPVKINAPSKTSQQDIKKALNLNQVLSESGQPKPPKNRLWRFLTLITTLVAAGLAIVLFWFNEQPFSRYQSIIPKETQAVAVIKTDKLQDLGSLILPDLENSSSFYRWLKSQVLQFLSDSNVSIDKDIAPLLEEELAILILPQETAGVSWAAIAQTKPNETQNQLVFSKIEAGLRRNFGLNQTSYRQIKINSVYSLDQIDRPYYYCQIKNFIVISNSLNGVKAIIDRIINNKF